MFVFARRTSAPIVVLFASAAVVSACDNGAATGVSPSANEQAAMLEIIAGNGQEGIVGRSLSEPLQVRVLNAQGKAVTGADVAWNVLEGNVRLGNDFSISRENGVASTTVLLGTKSGSVTISASIPESAADTIYFTLQALPDAPTKIVAKTGNQQIERPGASLPDPLIVEVQDQFGNPVPDVEVAWQTSAGTLSHVDSVTNDQGQARAQLALPPMTGVITVSVAMPENDDVPAANFTARATQIGIKAATTGNGNDQSAEVGSTLEAPYRVFAYDLDPDYGQKPIAGLPIRWVVPSGEGTVSASTTRTDETGHAEILHTLGPTVGQHRVGAVFGMDTVWFASTAHGPKGATQLVVHSGDKQTGSARAPLTEPLVVRILDKVGVPVSEIEVHWQVLSGRDGSIKSNRSVTDEMGFAAMEASLPSVEGDTLRVLAFVPALPDSIVFTAVAISQPKNAYYLEMTGQGHGNKQSGVVGTAVAQPLRVIVLDRDHHPVEGVEVKWRVLSGGGSVGASGNGVAVSYTDANGIATMTRILGPTYGEQQTEAYVPGLEPETVVFISYATSENRPTSMMIASSAEELKGVRESQLIEPLRVMVVDSVRSPVAGVAISWAVTAGNGVIKSAITTTDEDGIAENIFLIGGTKDNTVIATLPAIDATVSFDVIGTGPPATIQIVSGNNQVEVVSDSAVFEAGVTFDEPLSIRILDSEGAPVKGATITWTAVQGEGDVSGDGSNFSTSLEMLTDFDGISRILRRVAQPGESKTSAVVKGSFLSVIFNSRVNIMP